MRMTMMAMMTMMKMIVSSSWGRLLDMWCRMWVRFKKLHELHKVGWTLNELFRLVTNKKPNNDQSVNSQLQCSLFQNICVLWSRWPSSNMRWTGARRPGESMQKMLSPKDHYHWSWDHSGWPLLPLALTSFKMVAASLNAAKTSIHCFCRPSSRGSLLARCVSIGHLNPYTWPEHLGSLTTKCIVKIQVFRPTHSFKGMVS